MKAWTYTIGDVLRIERKGEQVFARIARFADSLDDMTPLYVNLRCAGGLRWSEATVKILKEQIVAHLPNWEAERKAAWEAELKAHADAIYARMTPIEREMLHRQVKQIRRSPIEVLIDRAVGLD